MSKNINYVSHKKSKIKSNGKPQLPAPSVLVEGEIAINYAKDVETLSIKNESGTVVTFSSDNYYTEKKLGSGFTEGNSAVTVTDVLEDCAYLGDDDGSATISDFDPQADTVWNKAQVLSSSQKAQVRQNIDVYSKAEVNNVAATPRQNYETVATYASLPSSGSTDTIYRVSSYNGTTSTSADTMYSEYAWDGSNYVLLAVKSQVDEVYDISANHAGATYLDLAAALGTDGDNIPQDLRRGGMSVKFIQETAQSSDNKYVQYRLMADSWSTVVTDWQGVDEEPTAGSKNLVESDGVAEIIEEIVGTPEEDIDLTGYTEQNGVIFTTSPYNFNSSGDYGLKNRYIIIPVLPRRDIRIVPINSTKGAKFAFLRNNVLINGEVPSFSIDEDYNHLINTYNSIVVSVPDDAKYMYIYTWHAGDTASDGSFYPSSVKYLAKRGLLDGKQDVLTFDETPTAGSVNPVTSRGVEASLDTLSNSLNTAEKQLTNNNSIRSGGNRRIKIISEPVYYGSRYLLTGQIGVANANYKRLQPIPATPTGEYWYTGTIRADTSTVGVVYVDINGNVLGRELQGGASAQNYTDYKLTIPNKTAIILATGAAANDLSLKVDDYEEKFMSLEKSLDVMPLIKQSVTLTTDGGRIDQVGEYYSSSIMVVSSAILIDKSKRYSLKAKSGQYNVAVCFYNSSEAQDHTTAIGSLYYNAGEVEFILTIPKEAVTMRVCSSNANILSLSTIDFADVLANNQGSENAGKVLGIGEDGNVVPTDFSSNNYVEKNQGIGYAGKVLQVGSNGMVTLGDGTGSAEDVSQCVRDKLTKTLYLGANLLTGVVGSGAGWSHSNGVYTHTTGNTDPLDFNFATDNGDSYVAIFKTGTSSFVENDVNISIGNGYLCDVYNGTAGPFRVGILSDGGDLKITPSSSYVNTIYDVELRKIVAEENADTSITVNLNNVEAGTMSAIMTGWGNVAIGCPDSLHRLQNGSRNISIGHRSMINMETGERNIGIGTFTLNQLKSGVRNIAIGADALYRSELSDDNVGIGKAALGFTHDEPSQHVYKCNVAIGNDAFGANAKNYTGNVGIGYAAGCGNISASESRSYNVAVGYESGYYGKSQNVAVGYRAGYYTKGDNNVAIGSQTYALYVTGDNNVFLGTNAYASDGTESSSNIKTINNTVALGFNARPTKSNQIMIGTSNHTEIVLLGNKKLIFNNDNTVTWEAIS